MTDAIIHPPTSGGALSAEHYQTFDMAKEHDDVLGGSDIAQIRSYSAFARARAQAVHKTIATMSSIDDVAATKAEMTETAQTFARVSVYADQRIGELLRELPTRQGKRTDTTSCTPMQEVTKAQAIEESGLSSRQAYDLQALAANPDVVEAVIAKAEAEGRIVSRKQVLDAIRERDDARETVSMVKKMGDTLRRQRDEAREDAEGYAEEIKEMQEEISALEKQADKAYEDGYRAAQAHAANNQPQVVEREVESEAARRRIADLEHERDVYLSDVQKLRRRNEDMRKELDKAKYMLGMDAALQDVRRDVHYLTNATNQYVRQYGGLTWTAESFAQVDADALSDLRRAATNLATFANALVASLEEMK